MHRFEVFVSIMLCSQTEQSSIITLYLLIRSLDYLNVLLGDSLLKMIAVTTVTVPTVIMWTGGPFFFPHCKSQDNAAFTLLI